MSAVDPTETVAKLNWEAVVAVGAFTAILGLALCLPARWWARRKLEVAPSEVRTNFRFTKIGLVFYTTMLILLGIGLLSNYVAPYSWLGQLADTGFGRLIILGVYLAIAVPVERLLVRSGVLLVAKSEQ